MTTFLIIALSAILLVLTFFFFSQNKKHKDKIDESNLLNKQLTSQAQSFKQLKQKNNEINLKCNSLTNDKQLLNNEILKKNKVIADLEESNQKFKLDLSNMTAIKKSLELENIKHKNIIIEQNNKYKDFEIVNQLYIKPYEGLKKLDLLFKDKEIEFQTSQKQYTASLNKIQVLLNNEKKECKNLSLEINDLKNIINIYKKDIDLYQETLNYYEYGISEPIFGHLDTERYKQSIKSEIEHQKLLVSENKGVINKSLQYTNESKSDFNKRIITINKNILSAFNREVENISLNLTIKNFNKMIERLQKTFETLNKNNSISDCHSAVISSRYFQSKKNELSFKFKYEHAKERAKEEQEEIKAQMIEEERESKIIEREQLKALKAAQKAEEEEIKFQEQLKSAQNELKRIMEEQSAENIHKLNQSMQQTEIMKNEMEDKIKLLQLELLEATKVKDRNLSMAQQTRKGHVYVISNVGSFGEGVYKIGMTRRLEPLDRVKELSSASVPFEFDIHAIIYSEDAPALEAELHRQFSNERVNLVNLRKEFFKVDLNSIQKFLDNKGINTEITLSALANNYYESISIRDIAKNKNVPVATLLRNHTENIEEDELEDTGTIDENIIQEEQPIIRTSMFG